MKNGKHAACVISGLLGSCGPARGSTGASECDARRVCNAMSTGRCWSALAKAMPAWPLPPIPHHCEKGGYRMGSAGAQIYTGVRAEPRAPRVEKPVHAIRRRKRLILSTMRSCTEKLDRRSLTRCT
jgi:hypothetical protein